LLLARKQSQMVPYLFAAGNNALDSLVEHVYSQSVADVLIKVLNLEESNFSEELALLIQKRKLTVITKLVNKLDNEDEESQQVASVLQELIQV
jgi:predicted DNA-binding ribbon-helix-helix protein